MRFCRSCRDEDAKAGQLSEKQRQIEAIVFFISLSFPIHSLWGSVEGLVLQ
jgi:hypothetical protein